MPRNRSAIDAGYIMHGHTEPGSEGGRGRGARAAWIGGGLSLVALGLTRRSPVARWLSVLGGGTMVALGAARTPLGRMGRRSGMAERVHEAEWQYIEANVVVDAPLADVYRFVRDINNWPRVFTGVKEAHLSPEGVLTWAFDVPGGRTMWWRGRLVEDYPEQILSWESASDNVFDETGSIRFDKEHESATKVTLAVSFRLAEGIPGMIAGERLGRTTEHITQQDLQHMKSLIEREMQPAGAR